MAVHQIPLTEEEVKLLLEVLNKVPVSGVKAMGQVLNVATKLTVALQPKNGAEEESDPKKPEAKKK